METVAVSGAERQQAEVSIQWKQLWSLASLYACIIIGWIAYENYQPRLLVQFHFTGFAFLLTTAQGIILAVTPLIAGKLGDRYRFEKGHRLPIISSGISFAAMVFMAVAFTLFSDPGEIFRWILPGLIVCWLIAMSVFTSPALSTMELFTPVDKLPYAMAVLTITGNLVYSLEPVIVDIIDYLGAPATFVLGGVLTFLSGYALKRNSLGLFKQTGGGEHVLAEARRKRSAYTSIFLMGVSLGVATAILFNLFPSLLHEKLGTLWSAGGKVLLVGALLLSAVLSLPVGHFANHYGVDRTFRISLLGLALTTAGLYAATSHWLVLLFGIGYVLTFTSLSVVSLPLAISRAAFREKVFCVGIFFSGAAIPDALWSLV